MSWYMSYLDEGDQKIDNKKNNDPLLYQGANSKSYGTVDKKIISAKVMGQSSSMRRSFDGIKQNLTKSSTTNQQVDQTINSADHGVEEARDGDLNTDTGSKCCPFQCGCFPRLSFSPIRWFNQMRNRQTERDRPLDDTAHVIDHNDHNDNTDHNDNNDGSSDRNADQTESSKGVGTGTGASASSDGAGVEVVEVVAVDSASPNTVMNDDCIIGGLPANDRLAGFGDVEHDDIFEPRDDTPISAHYKTQFSEDQKGGESVTEVPKGTCNDNVHELTVSSIAVDQSGVHLDDAHELVVEQKKSDQVLDQVLDQDQTQEQNQEQFQNQDRCLVVGQSVERPTQITIVQNMNKMNNSVSSPRSAHSTDSLGASSSTVNLSNINSMSPNTSNTRSSDLISIADIDENTAYSRPIEPIPRVVSDPDRSRRYSRPVRGESFSEDDTVDEKYKIVYDNLRVIRDIKVNDKLCVGAKGELSIDTSYIPSVTRTLTGNNKVVTIDRIDETIKIAKQLKRRVKPIREVMDSFLVTGIRNLAETYSGTEEFKKKLESIADSI
ncbi:hypothetical protein YASMINEVIRUS_1338 [Yasminevirus sp. GU-2018]|uniref:Uncharacterized protein n=1 Tax=Yasminevirus sp. GU-2018 TaxID=2420051 RepID=A0A5K0UC29_9VIRU|nr:hypothetical protein YASMINEVIRUS_1338 [Yasminevirus sp. GU-2018]